MTRKKKPHDVTPRPPRQPEKPQFTPQSEEQSKAYALLDKNDIAFLCGPAGCGKTFLAIAWAINHILEYEKKSDELPAKKILLTRPAVEACGEELGALPGGIAEKMQPFLYPLTDAIGEYARGIHIDFEIVAMAHLRGRTLKNTILVVDEAQNANVRQMRLALTRIGDGSKIIFCGDWTQADIRDSGLQKVITALTNPTINGIAHFKFSESAAGIRHPLIPKILRAMDNL